LEYFKLQKLGYSGWFAEKENARFDRVAGKDLKTFLFTLARKIFNFSFEISQIFKNEQIDM
jgi:hypothetical protein